MRGDKAAFTLAEVLITLVIIGIIAALTVPSLINRTNNQETVSRLKKVYSSLAQATNHIIAEEGSVKNWLTSSTDVSELYKKHLINAKECKNVKGCYSQGSYKYLNNSSTSRNWDSSSDKKLVLNDGSQIMFNSSVFYPNCNYNGYNGAYSDVCTEIYVDINGMKKPNILGRDVFLFDLRPQGLYPAGCNNIYKCTTSEAGFACACRVLRENAINY